MNQKRHKNHVISHRKIREFLENHPEHGRSSVTLDAWYKTVRYARWASFADVRETYADASYVDKLVVFNVGGNKFRIVAKIVYDKKLIFLRYVLTHSEYDRVNWRS